MSACLRLVFINLTPQLMSKPTPPGDTIPFFSLNADDNLIKFAVMNLGVCFRQLYGILKLRLLMLFVGDDVEIYGHGHTQFSYMFYEYENAYIIEDGLANYRKLESNFISNRLLNFLGLYIKGSKSG